MNENRKTNPVKKILIAIAILIVIFFAQHMLKNILHQNNPPSLKQ